MFTWFLITHNDIKLIFSNLNLEQIDLALTLFKLFLMSTFISFTLLGRSKSKITNHHFN